MGVRCRHIGFGVITLVALSAFPWPAAAQSAGGLEVSGGYNFLRVQEEEFEDEKNFPAGWYADVSGGLTDNLALVGQVTGNYKTIDDVDFKLHSFLGGVRLSSRANPNAVPFVHVLGGVFNARFSGFGESDSENDGALQAGGGVNLFAGGRVGLRLGVDYIRVFAEDEGTNLIRFGVGIVFGR